MSKIVIIIITINIITSWRWLSAGKDKCISFTVWQVYFWMTTARTREWVTAPFSNRESRSLLWAFVECRNKGVVSCVNDDHNKDNNVFCFDENICCLLLLTKEENKNKLVVSWAVVCVLRYISMLCVAAVWVHCCVSYRVVFTTETKGTLMPIVLW